jgi:uncharacterized protein YjbI with pentapeptide repeats
VILKNDADWTGIHLSGAQPQGAELRRTKLTEANMEGTNLRKADLDNADLNGTSDSRVTLKKADLTSADLTKCQVNTKLPGLFVGIESFKNL